MAGETHFYMRFLGIAACALVLGACSSPEPTVTGGASSFQAAAMNASQSGDQKTAVSLAEKEIERLSTPDHQCSQSTSKNCGTLALAYSSLADYQIRAGNIAAGESSFSKARGALVWMDTANRPSATAMVYRDVSEAFWKVGDRERAIAIYKEGREAGGDSWLNMCSAAQAVGPERSRTAEGSTDSQSAEPSSVL